MLHPIRLAALVAAALPALAGAATPSLAESLAQARLLSLADVQGRPGLRVRDSAEFERMKQYLSDHYAGVVVRHQFELSASQIVDCIDALTQPGARRHGLTRANWIERPRQAPAGQAWPGERQDVELARHRDEPGIFLAPADSNSAERDAHGQRMSCDRGTIPKLRLTLDRLASFESLAHFRHKRGQPGSGVISGQISTEAMTNADHEYAHAYDLVPNWGAESSLNIWGSYTELPSEFSLSQIWVVGGSGSGRQTVEAGWQVYRNRHLGAHPKNAHLFIYSTQDNYQDTGCYDLDCDDFVQTDSSVVIGRWPGAFRIVSGAN